MVHEHRRRAFDLTWWPIGIAIAWVCMRDRLFVERQWESDRTGLPSIDIALTASRLVGLARSFSRDPAAAWTELKGASEEGVVELIGTPFRRDADLNGAAVEISEMQRPISKNEIGSLMLYEDGSQNEVCLIPEDWRVARGSNWHNLRGYRRVQAKMHDVLRYFPVRDECELRSENIAPRDPKELGWMSVCEAAYWIASQGGQRSFDLREPEVWKESFQLLLPRICEGKIAIIGRKEGRGTPVAINPVSFVGIAIDYPYSDAPLALLLGGTPHLSCHGIGDGELWESTFHDSLMGEHRLVPEFSHLSVRNSDLAREFSFQAHQTSATNVTASSDDLTSRVRAVYGRLWPDGKCPFRVKERNRKICAEFERHPPSDRTIRRALEALK